MGDLPPKNQKKYNSEFPQTYNTHKTVPFIELLDHMHMHSNFGYNWSRFEWVSVFYVFPNISPLRCPLQTISRGKKKIKNKQTVLIL